MTLFSSAPEVEDPLYLSEQIITYLGNKRSLLPFIGEGLMVVKKRLGKERLRVLDMFSGSGVVARYLKQHSDHIVTNDLEPYSALANKCYLTNVPDIDRECLNKLLLEVKRRIKSEWSPGFITELYSPQDENNITSSDRCFYTRRNAIFLDTAAHVLSGIEDPYRTLLLGPLLSRASIHANTSGVFKGFYKNHDGVGQFGGNAKNALSRILGEIEIEIPILSRFACTSEVHQRDANDLVGDLPHMDLAYFDPPYNQHPYGSNYFMLNLLVNYERPHEISRVSGIPTSWNRSSYNQRKQAAGALFELVNRVDARFVLISYNSEGFIDQPTFERTLGELGEVLTLETRYNTFRGSRNLSGREIHVTEFLYLLEKTN